MTGEIRASQYSTLVFLAGGKDNTFTRQDLARQQAAFPPGNPYTANERAILNDIAGNFDKIAAHDGIGDSISQQDVINRLVDLGVFPAVTPPITNPVIPPNTGAPPIRPRTVPLEALTPQPIISPVPPTALPTPVQGQSPDALQTIADALGVPVEDLPPSITRRIGASTPTNLFG